MWSNRWNENWQRKLKYSEKPSPIATLSTTNLTWTDVGSNPGRRGGKPATNRMSYGTAFPPIHFAVHCHLQSLSLTLRKEKKRWSSLQYAVSWCIFNLIFVLFYDCSCWFSNHRSSVVDTGDTDRNMAVKIFYTEKTNNDVRFNP
jgi:hypothetical protein